MDYVRLGRSGLKVSRIGLGTNMIGAHVDREGSERLVNAYLDGGGNFIDTANTYAETRSEQYLGEILKGRKRHDVVLATKVFGTTGPGPHDHGTSRKAVMKAADDSLKRLQTDYIDLYYLHFWDPETPLEEAMRALDDLVRQGKVLYVACSNFAAWQLCKGLWTSDARGMERFVAVQSPYNFLERSIERELVPACLDQEVGIAVYQVLISGMVSGRYRPGEAPPPGSRMAAREAARRRGFTDRNFRVAGQVSELAARSGHSPVQLSIAWALHKPGITSVLAGASTPEQVRQNLDAASIKLSTEEMTALDKVGAA